MKLLDQLRLSLRSLKESKLRTFLTALAIAIGALTINLAMAASNGANGFIDKVIKSNFNPSELIVYKEKPQFGGIESTGPQKYNPDSLTDSSQGGTVVQLTNDDITKLKNNQDVESVRTFYQLTPNYIFPDVNQELKFTGSVQGIDPYFEPDLASGSAKDLSKDGIILPDSYLAVDKLNLGSAEEAIGKTVKINFSRLPLNNSANNQKDYSFKIVAVSKSKGSVSNQPNQTYINNDVAADINNYLTEGTVNEGKHLAVSVAIKNYDQKADYVDQDCLKQPGKNDASCTTKGTRLDSVKVKLNKDGFFAQTPTESISFITQFISILQLIVVGFGAITVIASVFGIINTQYISVLERTKEIGLMKALGMRSRNIMNLFEMEAALIGFIGGAIGGLIAYSLTLVGNPLIKNAIGLELLEFSFIQSFALTLVLAAVAVISGLLPARKAAKLDPIEALRTE